MHDAVAAEAIGEEESQHAGSGTDDGVMIRRDGVQARPGTVRIHLQVFETRHAADGGGQDLLDERGVEGGFETGRFFRRTGAGLA